jgi:hypothetical protein
VADTTFVNTVTLSDADWFNDLNRLHYTIFGDPADDAAARTGIGLGTGDSPTFTGLILSTLQVGTNPAGVSVAVIGIPNQKRIYGRNAANSADVNIAFIDGSNNLVLGPSDIVSISTSGLTVTGAVGATTLSVGTRSYQSGTDRISVTGATTIWTIATSGSSVGQSGVLLLVNGYDTGTTTKSFVDLVLFVQGVTPVVVSSTSTGSPAARTYTASGANAQLAMASGTYNVASSIFEIPC